MRAYHIVLQILMLVSANVFSQNNIYQLQVDLGKRVWQVGNVQNTLDGGIIVCGSVTDNLITNSFLVKISEYGQEQWKQTYTTGSLSNTGKFVIQVSDGGYMMVGEKSVNGISNDILIIRTDSTGNILWNKTYGNNSNDYGNNIISLSSGNFLICGESVNNFKKASFIRINPNGDVLETNYIDVAYASSTIKGKLVGPNNIIVTGSSVTEIFTDTSGNYLGQSNMQLADSALTTDVLITSSGEHITLANMFSGGSSNPNMFFLTKSDSPVVLPPSWISKIGATPVTTYTTTLMKSPDGSYMIAGSISPFFAPGVLFLTKVDTAGIPLWMNGYNPINSPDFFAGGAVATSDGGYILTGSGYVGLNKYDLFIIKTDSIGNSGCFQYPVSMGLFPGNYATPVQLTAASDSLVNTGTPILITNSNTGSFTVLCYTSTEFSLNNENESSKLYPNPFYNSISFKSNEINNGTYDLTIYDLYGKKINHLISHDPNWKGDEIEKLPAGLYIAEVAFNKSIKFRAKIIHADD